MKVRAVIFYNRLFKSLKGRRDIKIQRFVLNYKKGKYDFIRISSKNITKKDRVIILTAGIHGEEIAAPLTILNNINEILDYVHKNRIKIIIYPLLNPSGFDINERFNIDNDYGECGNNDFLRYVLYNDELKDEIKRGQRFKAWYWSSDRRLKIDLPEETKLMLKLIKKDILFNIKGLLELHQDYLLPNAKPACYHYSFGDLSRFNKIIKNIEKVIPIMRNRFINSGYKDTDTLEKIRPHNKNARRTDYNGFIVRNDGTLADLFYRLGVEYSVVVETTGSTPLNKACRVNMIWIKGLVDLIKEL